MPCRYHIDKELGVVFSEGDGHVTEADLQGHQDALREDTDFDPAYRQLFDFSPVTSFDLSTAFVQRFAARAVFSANARRAIVTPRDAGFGNARAFVAWHDTFPSEIQVFRDTAKARRWLGLEP